MHEIGKWIKLRAPTCNHKNAWNLKNSRAKASSISISDSHHIKTAPKNHESLARIREMENSFSKPA